MGTTTKIGLALMMAVTPAAVSAQTATTCLTDEDAASLVQFAAPGILDQVSRTCAASLPANAYLTVSRPSLVQRYAKAADAVAEPAKRAFAKVISLSSDKLALLQGDGLKGLLDIFVAQAIGGKVKAQDCSLISEVLQQFDPLPPENVARIVTIAIREGSKPKPGGAAKASPFTLCGARKPS